MLTQFSSSKIADWADGQHPDKSSAYRIAHSICRIGLITAREFQKNELSLRAAALTFTVMLSLVPILAMSTAVVKGLGGSDQLKKVVYGYVATLDNGTSATDNDKEASSAPDDEEMGSSLPQHLYSAVDKIFNYVDRTNFATLGTIGVAGILLSVILVLGNIELAMNAIWHVESGRSIMRKISDYLTLIVLMPLSVNIGLASSAVLKSEALLSRFSVILPMVWIQAIILKLIPVFFLALTLYVIYLFFPNTKVKTIPAMAGALFAGFFWFEAQNIYIGLQVGVAKYNAIYGSFATLPLFLVWIYFGWIFILLGAQIAYAYQNKDSLRLSTPNAPPSLRLAAAYDILDYVRKNFDAATTATVMNFMQEYPVYKRSLINATIAQLQEHELIHFTDNKKYLKPSLPKAKLDQSKIIGAIFGTTYSDTPGGQKSSMILKAAAHPPQSTSDQVDEEGLGT